MSTDETRRVVSPTLRLILLIVGGIVVGNVVVTMLINRDTGLGLDELLAFGGGAALGLLVEFGVLRRTAR
jgi:hypothetical protein